MGAYGGTPEAGKTPIKWTLLADLTNDGIVDAEDFACLSADLYSLKENKPGDLNRNGTVLMDDLEILIDGWLKMKGAEGEFALNRNITQRAVFSITRNWPPFTVPVTAGFAAPAAGRTAHPTSGMMDHGIKSEHLRQFRFQISPEPQRSWP